MNNYEAKLIGRERMAGDVGIFRFERPTAYDYAAGQYCLLSVPPMGFQDDRGLRRAFSIASSPLEKDLLIVTKLSNSAMKQTMAEMPLGTVVTLTSAMGALVLPKETGTPLAFLAGGIGITPFRSMCRYAADARSGHTVTLFYSSKTPEETPFLEELMHIPEENKNVVVAVTMTRAPEDPKAWSGPRGRLSAEMIKEHLSAWERAFYYVAGPPAMSDAMKQTLDAMNIPAERI